MQEILTVLRCTPEQCQDFISVHCGGGRPGYPQTPPACDTGCACILTRCSEMRQFEPEEHLQRSIVSRQRNLQSKATRLHKRLFSVNCSRVQSTCTIVHKQCTTAAMMHARRTTSEPQSQPFPVHAGQSIPGPICNLSQRFTQGSWRPALCESYLSKVAQLGAMIGDGACYEWKQIFGHIRLLLPVGNLRN